MKDINLFYIISTVCLFSLIHSGCTNAGKTALEKSDVLIIRDTNLIYSFVKSITDTNSVGLLLDIACKIVDEPRDLEDIYSLDTFFNEKDFQLIRDQIGNKSAFFWDAKRLSNYVIINNESIIVLRNFNTGNSTGKNDNFWNNYYQLYQTGFTKMSVPIFNADKKLAIIKVGYYCGGLCGGGDTKIYKFRNGIWAEVYIISSWVS